MTDANYQKHFKILGKLAKLYDLATADISDLQTLLAAFVDQYATGTWSTSEGNILLFPTYTTRWDQALDSGASTLQTIAKDAASAYLVDTTVDFDAGLTTVPAAQTAAATLTALATEMTSVATTKTLTTKSSTGMVNFFDAILGSSGSWNTASPGDYPDSTYVVSTVV